LGTNITDDKLLAAARTQLFIINQNLAGYIFRNNQGMRFSQLAAVTA